MLKVGKAVVGEAEGDAAAAEGDGFGDRYIVLTDVDAIRAEGERELDVVVEAKRHTVMATAVAAVASELFAPRRVLQGVRAFFAVLVAGDACAQRGFEDGEQARFRRGLRQVAAVLATGDEVEAEGGAVNHGYSRVCRGLGWYGRVGNAVAGLCLHTDGALRCM